MLMPSPFTELVARPSRKLLKRLETYLAAPVGIRRHIGPVKDDPAARAEAVTPPCERENVNQRNRGVVVLNVYESAGIADGQRVSAGTADA